MRYATGQDFFHHHDETKGRQLVYMNENLDMGASTGCKLTTYLGNTWEKLNTIWGLHDLKSVCYAVYISKYIC